MKKYEYMIVYKGSDIGRICMTLDSPISSYDDVKKLDKELNYKSFDRVELLVIDFKLLREYEED